ncbi:MAG: SDR family NAD(P)-dependent oxidoreductase [Vicinamibacterales bacterium]
MTRQPFVVGLIAGVAAVVGGYQLIRSRHRIDFTGRLVVITGGSRGLGLVLARQFATQGARVCLLARDEEELDRAAAQVAQSGAAGVETYVCDVRSQADVERVITEILFRHSGIDVLVNNAGAIQVGPLEHMKVADFENAMATHFWGPLYSMQACLPAMKRRGFGRIVNIASIGGRIAVPHLAPYSASKFALVGLSDAFRAEVAQFGVHVTTVSPGLMRTGSPINAEFKGQHDQEFAWFAIADAIPGMSIGAERAARQIVDACRHGDPELTISVPAKAAVLASALAPTVFAELMAAVVRCLPASTGASGDRPERGKDTRSPWAPSAVTTLSDRAAVGNNEM